MRGKQLICVITEKQNVVRFLYAIRNTLLTTIMTLEQIELALPNGFHDAFLCALSVDYVGRKAEMEIEIWVGSMNTSDYQGREAYRRGRLQFLGLLLFTSEIPNGEFLSDEADDLPNGLSIDISPVAQYPSNHEGKKWPDEPLPEGAFQCAFCFMGDANSYLRIAARDVKWTWLSEPRTIY
jgi:hypothetical protein